ncbi:MAG: M23 family metallopeptidase [bacterium]|nr:M23 family metallopeptidase [bacterium]
MKSFILLILGLGILFVAVSYIPGSHEFTQKVFDRTAPTIFISEIQDGAIKIDLTEQGAGLRAITINAKQGETNFEMYREEFPKQTLNRSITLPFDLQSHGFKEGDVTIEISINDSALFSNKTTASKSFLLDFVRPQLELLSLQHIANQGGVEFVVFRAADGNLTETGVLVGDYTYPGFPISFISPSIAANTQSLNLYAALFALPFDFDSTKSKISLFAKDSVGNLVSQQISFRLANFKQPDVTPQLSRSFLERKIPELFDKYLLVAAKPIKLDLTSDEGLVKAFKLVNEEYRKILDQELNILLELKITPRQGTGIFIKPMSSATSSSLGEKRAYTYDGKSAGYSVHNGLDLASVQNDSVLAAQDGTVLLAKDHGIYGNTVVLDHGLGISSLYGHLASILVNVGDKVSKGSSIGRSGQTGLAGGDHLHFEIRVRATPVNPIEWWDAKWIEDNIDGKVKKLLTEYIN